MKPEIEAIVEQASKEIVRNLFPERRPILITEGKSYGTRRTFSDEKQTFMNTLVQLVGSLKGNLDQKLIKDSIAAYDDLKVEFKDALMGLLKSYQAEEITAEEFTKQVQKEIREAWAAAYEAGVGSVGNPAGVFDEDFSWLKGARAEEYGYLNQFVDDMENDAGTMDYETRMQLYVDTLDGVFNHGKVEGSPEGVSIFWETHPGESCTDCLEFEAGSPYQKDTLPATPGDGTSACKGNCNCTLRFEPSEDQPEPGMRALRAIETRLPRIPAGKRLPTYQEYEKISSIQAEIDRVTAMINATSGQVKKDFIDTYRDLVHDRVATIGTDIYYVPKSNYFQGAENPFLKESLDDGSGPRKIPEGYRSPSEGEKVKLDAMITEVNDLRMRISSATNGDRKDLIGQRFRLNEELIDFMEKHKIFYVPESLILPAVSPDHPREILIEQLAQGIVRDLFGSR